MISNWKDNATCIYCVNTLRIMAIRGARCVYFRTRDELLLNNFMRPVLHSTDMFAVVDKVEIEASAGISRNFNLVLMVHLWFWMYKIMAIMINLLNRHVNPGEIILRYMWRYLNVICADNCAANDNVLAFLDFNINTFKAELLLPLLWIHRIFVCTIF